MKLHINDVASFLNLPANTLKRWIRQGRVPIHRSDDTCIFKKEKLEEWAKRNNLSFSDKACSEKRSLDNDSNILSTAISNGEVFYDLDEQNKNDLFEDVVNRLSFNGKLKDQFLKRLLEREEMSSTGIGRGVAIPHPREPLGNFEDGPKILIVFVKEPIDYDSIDNQKVFVLFFILSRDVKEHLKLLSNLSYCLRHDSFINFLKKKPAQEDILNEVESFEQKLEKH